VSRTVSVDAGPSRYIQNISVGPHAFPADEPVEVGGNDAGPNLYELLMAALGACASITVRMYTERKLWPLQGVHLGLSYSRVDAEDCTECDTEVRMVDQMEMEISFIGDLSEDQRTRLMEIANKCPVHRTLSSQVQIRSRIGRVDA
jgi:putative redox protein